jgi:hypothetical protein
MSHSITEIIHAIRRNHALEHASLLVLAAKKGNRNLAGYSDWRGFWVLGEVDTEDLLAATQEALTRLKAGESRLAIHPNCGTNFAVSGVLAGSAAWLAMAGTGSGWKKKLERFPLVITLVTLVMILSQPLGPKVQSRVTTCPIPGKLQVVSVQQQSLRNTIAHRVLTKDALA